MRGLYRARLGNRLFLAALCTALLVLWSAPTQALEAAPAKAASVPDTMAQRVLACTLCHGAQGRATNNGYFPRIAGKTEGYLFNQLLNFRDGRRQNPGMAQLLDNLSDAYLRDIARHFAQLDLPYAAPLAPTATPIAMARGQQLVQQGDAASRVPACVACHGDALTGMQPATPGLLGLPRDYLIGQLGAWQTGSRHAVAPDCMAATARALTPTDVGAVASWLSAQAVPTNAHPAPAPLRGLPLRCGSAAAP